jgi:hypothetical protein
MFNDRKIEDPALKVALDEVQRLMTRRGYAGAVMIVGEREAAFGYVMAAPWSAIRAAPGTPMGFRITAKQAELGAALAASRMEGAAHTICQLQDFGQQTASMMADLLNLLKGAGITVEHTPFNGQPMPRISAIPG